MRMFPLASESGQRYLNVTTMTPTQTTNATVLGTISATLPAATPYDSQSTNPTRSTC